MVDITEIREALTLYFIRQLADDEAQRAARAPRERQDCPEWSSIDKWGSDPDSQIGDYHEYLTDELMFNFTRQAGYVLKVMEEFGGVKIEASSDQFNWVYREFIKTEIEVIKVIEERIKCDYSVEMRYLWGDDTGLSSSAVALCDVSQPRSLFFQNNIRQRGLEQKLLKHSQEGVQAKKEKDDKKYAKFNECVLGQLKTSQGSSSGQWLAQHCKRHVEVIENSPTEETLRKRADKIKKQYLASK